MSKATLRYVLKDKVNNEDAVLYLESGPLRYVDYCTKRHKDEKALRNSPIYKKRIDNFANSYNQDEGYFSVSYIEDSDKREELPILYDDQKAIVTNLEIGKNHNNQIERARHLLWTSKEDKFLEIFLDDERFTDTTFFNIKLSNSKEIKKALESDLKPRIIGGENYLSIQEILRYKLENNNQGIMRNLIEDALEVWKEKLYELDGNSQYYYARHLRYLEKEYGEFLDEKKMVINLDVDATNLYEVVLDGTTLMEIPIEGRHTYHQSKQKILLDERKETA